MKTEENINNDPNLKKGKKLGKTKKKERKLNQLTKRLYLSARL